MFSENKSICWWCCPWVLTPLSSLSSCCSMLGIKSQIKASPQCLDGITHFMNRVVPSRNRAASEIDSRAPEQPPGKSHISPTGLKGWSFLSQDCPKNGFGIQMRNWNSWQILHPDGATGKISFMLLIINHGQPLSFWALANIKTQPQCRNKIRKK